jgi:hypothetical protein
LAAALGALWLAAAQPAAAETRFCSPGTAAGQCSSSEGLATDFESGRLYVADRANNRVDVFEVEAGGGLAFKFAFGWGVDTGASQLETCTDASTCQKGISGAGVGALSSPTWIAVDNGSLSTSHHDVYVTDANHRVQKFGPAGNFLLMFGAGVNSGTSGKPNLCTNAGAPTDVCGAGTAGTAPGQFEEIRGVGVSGTGTAYVVDTRDEGACEGDVNKGPEVFKRVQKYDGTGEASGELLPSDVPCGPVTGFAVDSTGRYWVASEVTGQGLRRYAAAGTVSEAGCAKDLGVETNGLAVDGADRLFASQVDVGLELVTEFGTSCEYLRRFGYGTTQLKLVGLAAYHSPAGDVFGSELEFTELEGSKEILYLKEPGPGPVIAQLQATPHTTWTQIAAKINPEGETTKYKVEWVDQHSFETEGGFASPNKKSSAEATLVGSGFTVVGAETIVGCRPFSQAELEAGKCLVPETTYRYRLKATNTAGSGEAEGQFTTGLPLAITSTFASGLGTDTATLNGQLNPLGSPATGYFEYAGEGEYEAGIEAAEGEGKSRAEAEAEGRGFENAAEVPDVTGGQSPLSFGEGEAAVRQSATLSPLAPASTYHFRLVASDPFGTRVGPERVLTTYGSESAGQCPVNEAFRSGPSALLPDCRAYELVTPVDKEGGDIVVLPEAFTERPAVLAQSALSGQRLAYGSYRAFGGAESSPYTTQYVAARGGGGWTTHGISPRREAALRLPLYSADTELRFLSPELCESWQIPLAEPPLAVGALEGYANLYRRSDQLCGGAPTYTALSTAKPQHFGGGTDKGGASIYGLELQGVSADGQTAIFAANDSLSGAGAPPNPESGNQTQLYAKAAGGVGPKFVCVLPGGGTTPFCSAGSGEKTQFPHMKTASETGALSADGKRVFWSNVSSGEGKIYLRENPLGSGSECATASAPCSVAVSAGGEAMSGSTKSFFWAGAEDGSSALYSSGVLASGSADLYSFTVEGAATKKIAGQVFGVVGQSENLSRVYFATKEARAGTNVEEENSEGAKAVAGSPNLYLYEAGGGGSYRFVATLASADVSLDTRDQNQSSATSTKPDHHNGQATADGGAAAFMSAAPLTGFDNTDAASAAPCGSEGGICDNEAFVYDAAARGGEGELICASCNPSGARPAGRNVGGGGNQQMWIAARTAVFETTLYQPQMLAGDGRRLFFESVDPLVASDSNGQIDVYEWERAGVGSCEEDSASYSPPAAGCIAMISSGQSKRDSEIVDVSASGGDVFFATLSSLLPYDPGQVDIYDARVDGGLAAPPTPAPECEAEDCQHPPPSPVFATPASGAEGPGNVKETVKKHKHKTKHHKKGKKGKKKHRAKDRHGRGAGR